MLVPMITLLLEAVKMGVAGAPDGDTKLLMFQDEQSGITVHVPLGSDACRALRDSLSDADIQVAKTLPLEVDTPMPMNREARRAAARRR